MHGPVDARLSEDFARGDYHAVAATGPADRWETHAALALCGNIAPALEALRGFDCPEARFHEGVAHWLVGDEDAAMRRLENCEGAHARNLRALIAKPRISVLAQLPWIRAGAHTILTVAENDPKFKIRNISFHPDDLPNEPYGDIHNYYDADAPPDFYISEMVEWHFVPPNIQELACPILGHTADFDLHIQVLHPWLRLFDEVLVTDTTEHAAVTGLVDAPVTTVPKAFALPWTLPEPPDQPRDLDLVLTGSLFHSFYPDKSGMIHRILQVEKLRPFFVNGFLPDSKYFETLARSKLSVACLRHPGATPTRGLETLAMGCTLLAQSETTLGLWLDEADGLLTYDLADDSLRRNIEKVIADPEAHAARAKRGMEIVRREFDPWQVGAHYLRMAAFIAARPRGPRAIAATQPEQKRPVARKGWLPHNHERVLPALRTINLDRFRETPADKHTVQSLNDPARELLLEHAYAARRPFADLSEDQRLPLALDMYRAAIPLKPDSLALRFNFIRAALHFGSDADIEQALSLARETIETDASHLTLDPLDDVMPWDYCQDFFNYRDYFVLTTRTLAGRADGISRLKDMIYASLHYYYGRMAGEPGHFADAARCDPAFPAYRLWQAKHLASANDPASTGQAVALLQDLAETSMYAIEAWSLLDALKQERGLEIPGDDALRRAMARLESHTVLDEDYRSLRYSPYFRAQRLGLARSGDFAILKDRKKQDGGTVRVSVLLADTNGSRYGDLPETLASQTLPRDRFEVICADVFDRPAPRIMAAADMVLACGQSEYLYNRNAAFNFAFLQAKGDIIVYFDRAPDLAPDTLAKIADALSASGATGRALTNRAATEFDRFHLHTLALRRDDLLLAGGLDESAYYGGALGGPHELARRLARRRFRLDDLDGVPAADAGDAPAPGNSLECLTRELWPDSFSPLRGTAIRSNREILNQRAALA